LMWVEEWCVRLNWSLERLRKAPFLHDLRMLWPKRLAQATIPPADTFVVGSGMMYS